MYVEECANMYMCMCKYMKVVISKVYKLLVISVRNK